MEEENSKYFYGASVQGIQSFIFQTNKLKEIVGASELVEQICTSVFDGIPKQGTSIVQAAGNIKYIFDSEENCRAVVLKFPKMVMEKSPGITVSQAVVKYDSSTADYKDVSRELEMKLQAQRNKPVRSMTLGLQSISRSPTTGLPAVGIEDSKLIDEGVLRKLYKSRGEALAKKAFGTSVNYKQIVSDIDQIDNENNWIAIIHADGNGLGKIIRQIGCDLDAVKKFSCSLNKCTEASARAAFQEVQLKYNLDEEIPIRPLILGGDDFMALCPAYMAIDYTKALLSNFEKQTKECFQDFKCDFLKNGLTMCAGIAFVKPSFPFHYAADLAESLCKEAKKKVKPIGDSLPPSCLMFHKVQDSFIESYEDIVNRELLPQKNISFKFGPYLIKGQEGNLIDRLEKLVEKLKQKEGNALKSHLRQWVAMLYDDVDAADQKLQRIEQVMHSLYMEFNLDSYRKKIRALEKEKKHQEGELTISPITIPYYDMLSLLSVSVKRETNKSKKNE